MDVWLYPGASMSVTSLTKVTLTPAAVGELPPPGATIIPPQAPAHMGMLRQAAAANLEVSKQGLAAAQEMTHQSTQEANATLAAALAQTNQEAVKLSQESEAAQPGTPPWEVTFAEKR